MFFDHIDEIREMILAGRPPRPREGAGQAAAVPAQRLRRPVPGDGRPAGDDPPARSAAARVPAARRPTSRPSWPKKIGMSADAIARRVQELHESNPMLGHRGCRLGIVYPEITRMQARAIFEAACDVQEGRHRGASRSDDSAGRLRHRVHATRRRSSARRPRRCSPRRA